MDAAKSGAAFAGAAMGIEGQPVGRLKDMAVSAVKTTDQLTQLRARIDLINDGSQSTAEIMDKVFSAANRSRGSFLDMADSVAKLNLLAKDAFTSNDEAIYFVEHLISNLKLPVQVYKKLHPLCISLHRLWQQVSYRATNSVPSWKMLRCWHKVSHKKWA